jgi:hypothetical protein
VLEYVARYLPAARITIAEGGSYRGLHDPAERRSLAKRLARGRRVLSLGRGRVSSHGGTLAECCAVARGRAPQTIRLRRPEL